MTGRLKHGTGKNRRGCKNQALCELYRSETDICELLPLLHKSEIVVRYGWITASIHHRRELHHIFGGKQRWDLRSNLIMLNHMIHGCCSGVDQHDMRIACLTAKMRKAKSDPEEFDIVELNQACGMARPDAMPVLSWLETHPSADPIFEAMRTELLSEITRRI